MCFDWFADSCTLNQTRIAWKSSDAKADEFHEFRPGERQSQYICTKTGSSCCRRESSHLGRSSKWTGKRHAGCRAVRRGKRQAKRESEQINELSLSRASCKHFTWFINIHMLLMRAIVTREIGQSQNLHHHSSYLLPHDSATSTLTSKNTPSLSCVHILFIVHAPLFECLSPIMSIYFHVRSPPATLGLVKERAPTLLHHCGPCCWAPQAVPISPTWHGHHGSTGSSHANIPER